MSNIYLFKKDSLFLIENATRRHLSQSRDRISGTNEELGITLERDNLLLTEGYMGKDSYRNINVVMGIVEFLFWLLLFSQWNRNWGYQMKMIMGKHMWKAWGKTRGYETVTKSRIYRSAALQRKGSFCDHEFKLRLLAWLCGFLQPPGAEWVKVQKKQWVGFKLGVFGKGKRRKQVRSVEDGPFQNCTPEADTRLLSLCCLSFLFSTYHCLPHYIFNCPCLLPVFFFRMEAPWRQGFSSV